MTPQTTSPVSPDASRKVDRPAQAAAQAQPCPHRKYDVDDLFGVFP